MPFSMARAARNIRGFGPPRRRNKAMIIVALSMLSTFSLMYTYTSSQCKSQNKMAQTITQMQTRLACLESLNLVRLKEIKALQKMVFNTPTNQTINQSKDPINPFERQDQLTPEDVTVLKNMNGSKSCTYIDMHKKPLPVLQGSFVGGLLPHLVDHPDSLVPAYHLKSDRQGSEIVIAIPTVMRDKQSYLMETLEHLISRLKEEDENNTLIVILVGETDLTYILKLAKKIENQFQSAVKNGLIEIISPSASYYPNFDELPQTLGDSLKRVKWRTKQNLDTLYLMAYAQTRGNYYLMLEDDVIASRNYMQEIKNFVSTTTVTTPDWFILEFCSTGGIGKLFKSSDLINFILYVQLFYRNMPIDWLIESYLADRVCTNEKNTNPRYGTMPLFYPHMNPSVTFVRITIKQQDEHTIQDSYQGKNYFWGIRPQKGQVIEFWFLHPQHIASYTFRSGNVQHPKDKFYNTLVEVCTYRDNTFVTIDEFDEFGLADGKIDRSLGPITAIRLRVTKDSRYWVVLSEIDIKPYKTKTKVDDLVKFWPKSLKNNKAKNNLTKRMKHGLL